MSFLKDMLKASDPAGTFFTQGRGGNKKAQKTRDDTLRILDNDRSSDGTAGLQQITSQHIGGDNGQDSLTSLEATGANAVREVAGGSSRGIRDGVIDVANQVGVREAANDAKSLAGRVADVSKGTFDRNTSTFDLSDRQKRAGSRRLSLNRAVNQAGAGTAVRSGGADSARNAMESGVALENMAFSQEIAGLSGLANADGQKKIRIANEKAQRQQERNNNAKFAVGLVASVLSSEERKDKIEVAPKLLDKLKSLRVDKWRYNGGHEDTSDHVGPYAEEFNEMFGTQKKDTSMINVIDLVGVALGSVKELDRKVEALTDAHS